MSPRRAVILALLGCASLAPLSLLHAQPKPLPPTRPPGASPRATGASTPSLPVPEYTIRGKDTVGFTGMEKARAFIPQDSLWSEVLGSLRTPTSVLDPFHRPHPEGARAPSDRTLRLEAGIGSYASPRVGLWYGDVFPVADLFGAMIWERSLGYLPEASFTDLRAEVGGRGFLPMQSHPFLRGSSLEGRMVLSSRDYSLFGQQGNRAFPDLRFDRTAAGFSLESVLRSRNHPSGPYHLGLRVDMHSWTETMRDGWIGGDITQTTFDERRLGLDASTVLPLPSDWNLPFSSLTLSGRIDLHFGSPLSARDQRPFFSTAQAMSSWRPSREWVLDGGLAVFLARGSLDAFAFRLFPRATLRYLGFDEDLTLSLEYFGGLRENSSADQFAINPALMLGAPLLHEDLPLELTATARYDDGERVRATAGVMVQRYAALPVPTLLPPPLHRQWTLANAGASTIMSLFIDGTRDHSAYDRSTVRLLLRQSHSSYTNDRLPYLPSAELSFEHRHIFPFSLVIDARAILLGSRLSTTEGDIGSVLVLSTELSYPLLPRFSVFLSLDNLTDASYSLWDGVPSRPFFMMLGVRATL